MCGIVAVAAARGERVDLRLVEQMRDRLAHRGPDAATSESVDDWVGLGHRRLSIIDLEGARQPLRGEDGNVVCIFNGEIYNFVELRARLIALGHTFTTAGDGEVIVHGYEAWGTEVFAALEGMFAIVLVDRARRRMLIARDRFGIKPLFYAWNLGRLSVASELKALLADPACPRVASRAAMALGAVRMHVPWPYTAFAGIHRLPPGAFLEVRQGEPPRLARYTTGGVEPAANRDDTLDRLRTAVARQMVADVPVGAFLSGGIDSTLIVSLMREISNGPIHTFSIRTTRDDESDVATETARELGTIHHNVDLEEIGFADLLALAKLYDEPFAETSALGVLALSRFARRYVKVALSGDGGDEVFGGYGSYRWIRDTHRFPAPGRPLLGVLVRKLLLARAWPELPRRLLRAALLVGDPPATAQRDLSTLLWAASDGDRTRSETLSREIARAWGGGDPGSPFREAMRADRLERLSNAMLTKVDVASMAASLEVRVPMLDDALVRFADRLPADQLADLRWGKVVLRRLLSTRPGGQVAWAAKRGFSLPLESWMRGARLAPQLEALLNDQRATLLELTGQDVSALWRGFVDRSSRFSEGTAAMQLLWFATVASWSQEFGVRTVGEDPPAPVA